MNHRGTFENHRLCFFIDGLDEYQGRIQEDPKHLVDQLCGWTETHKDSIKLCVSSREYNVFMNAFSPQLRVRLHQLTRRDVDSYARDRLTHMPRKGDQDLALMITQKAEGIFLWVALVIRRLREQFEDGASFDELVQDLDSLPEELEDLYAHILKSLSPRNRKRAYQTFAVLLCSDSYQVNLSLFAYSFLERYHTNQSFATAHDLDPLETPDPETGVCQIAEESARKRMNGVCKGLVELVSGGWHHSVFEQPGSTSPSSHPYRLAFTHRTVPEFLQSGRTKGEMDTQLQGFVPEDVVSQLFLAEVRYLKSGCIPPGRMSASVSSIVRMRMERNLDSVPYTYLERLENIARRRHDEQPSDQEATLIAKRSHVFIGNLVVVLDQRTSSFPHITIKSEIPGSNSVISPLFISAFAGNLEYVEWRIRHDPTAIDTHRKVLLLYHCVERGFPYYLSKRHLHLIDLLHEKGLSPSLRATFHSFEFQPNERASEVHLSLWEYIILDTIARIESGRLEHFAWRAQVIEKLLQLGADRHLSVRQVSAFQQREREELASSGPSSAKIDVWNPQSASLLPQATSIPQHRSPDKPHPSLDQGCEPSSRNDAISPVERRSSEDESSSRSSKSSDTAESDTREVELICGQDGHRSKLRYTRRSRLPTDGLRIFRDEVEPISLRDMFKAWNPGNTDRLLELLEEDEAGIEGKETTKQG